MRKCGASQGRIFWWRADFMKLRKLSAGAPNYVDDGNGNPSARASLSIAPSSSARA